MNIVYTVATVIMIVLLYEIVLKIMRIIFPSSSKEQSIHEHRYGTVQKDGYQYCTSCNSARSCGTIPCSHVWEILYTDGIIETLSFPAAVANARTCDEIRKNMEPRNVGWVLVMKCKKCGCIEHKKIQI